MSDDSLETDDVEPNEEPAGETVGEQDDDQERDSGNSPPSSGESAGASEQADEPDLGDDDYVHVDPDMAAAVAGEDEEDDQEDGDDSDDDGGSSSKSATETLTTGTSAGDIYCNALGMGAAVARESKGSGVPDREAAMDEYGDLARQLDLDDFVNEWVREHGGADELTPGQGVMIGTAMFAMAVMIEDPAIVENMGDSEGVEA